MEKVSYITVVIVLLSVFFLREAIKSGFSNPLGCYYGENILIDSRLYTSSSLVCSKGSYFLLAISNLLSLLFLSLLFKFLDDTIFSTSILIFSFTLFFIDLLSYYYANLNYFTFIVFLPFMFFSIVYYRG
ncbi:MAG: hypothetical protein QXL14_00820 [Candidatus Aenigmatarchaeota archaeon]